MSKDKQLPWRETAANLPAKPGVYLFRDDEGRVIYVGKAASLAKRLAAYTRPAADAKTRALLAAARGLDYILTDSELDALMLENVLIKKEQPRYNIILRDDKNYPYLYLNPAEPFPRLQVVRRMGKKKEGFYYGPYVPTNAMRATLKLLGRIFPLRQCSRLDFKRQRPCLNYQMKRCLAPCKGLVSRKDYQELVKQTRYFLEGRNRRLQGMLRRKMQQAAARLQFERAARLRDALAALERVSEQQKIISADRCNADVIGLASEPRLSCCAVLFIRQGMVIGHKSMLMESRQETLADREVLAAFIQQLYSQGGPQIPPLLVLPLLPAAHRLLADWLSKQRGQGVRLLVPRQGRKRRLVEMAAENARTALQQRQRQEENGLALSLQLQADLALPHPPRRIEAFDISNIQGREAVGSLVVWERRGFLKRAYRHFSIRTVTGSDDYAMLAEVIRRRYRKAADREQVDLILIDGGKGQVNTAWRVLNELGRQIPLLGLAKREEAIYFPHRKNALRLAAESPSLRLLQRVRDEAHRFALRHHRQRRGRSTLSSPLEQIPGIGPARRRALLAHFGGLEQIKAASREQLSNLPFLPAPVAQRLYEYWHC